MFSYPIGGHANSVSRHVSQEHVMLWRVPIKGRSLKRLINETPTTRYALHWRADYM